MKQKFFITVITFLFLIFGFKAQIAAAALAADNPTPLDYERYESYFEKNNSGLTGKMSFLMFNEKAKFDEIFGAAARAGNGFLPGDVFETRFIFAVIKRGNFTTSYLVTNVVRDFDKLRIYYETTDKPAKSGTFASPLILAIDKENFNYSGITVSENGKVVFSENFND